MLKNLDGAGKAKTHTARVPRFALIVCRDPCSTFEITSKSTPLLITALFCVLSTLCVHVVSTCLHLVTYVEDSSPEFTTPLTGHSLGGLGLRCCSPAQTKNHSLLMILSSPRSENENRKVLKSVWTKTHGRTSRKKN